MAARKAQYHWGWDWLHIDNGRHLSCLVICGELRFGPDIGYAGLIHLKAYGTPDARGHQHWTPVPAPVVLWPKTQLSADHQTAEVTAVIDVESVGDGDYTAQVCPRSSTLDPSPSPSGTGLSAQPCAMDRR
jgi:beta-mannosidase